MDTKEIILFGVGTVVASVLIAMLIMVFIAKLWKYLSSTSQNAKDYQKAIDKHRKQQEIKEEAYWKAISSNSAPNTGETEYVIKSESINRRLEAVKRDTKITGIYKDGNTTIVTGSLYGMDASSTIQSTETPGSLRERANRIGDDIPDFSGAYYHMLATDDYTKSMIDDNQTSDSFGNGGEFGGGGASGSWDSGSDSGSYDSGSDSSSD